MTSTKVKKRRWVCDQCGTGALGSERPRRDDIVRYCLLCSKKTGRLVQRHCPSIEQKRTAKTERLTARRSAKAKTERTVKKERRTILGLDIDAEATRIWNLPIFKAQPRWQPKVPAITVRRSAKKLHTSGHSYFNHGGIVLTIGSDEHEALGVLLHELAHPIIGKPNGQIHPESFWRFVRSAAREAWPNAEFRFNEPAKTGWLKQAQVTKGLRRQAPAKRNDGPPVEGLRSLLTF